MFQTANSAPLDFNKNQELVHCVKYYINHQFHLDKNIFQI